MAEPKGSPKIDCLKCVHFYVTWDAAMPRGCRALGFKCRELPANLVRASSGSDCLYYQPRPPRGCGRRAPRT